MKFVLSAGFAATPLLFMQSLLDPAQSIRYLYLTLFTAAITGYYCIASREETLDALSQTITWRNPLFIAGMLWLAATLLSLNAALQKSEGLAETARVIFFMQSFLFVSAWVKIEKGNIAALSAGFCMICLILTTIGFRDLYQAWRDITPEHSYYHISGNMGNRNLLAIMLSVCLPFHFIVFEKCRIMAVRWALAIAFLCSLSLIVLTSSRTGWLSLAVLFFVFATLLAIGYCKGFFPRRIIKNFSIGCSVFLLAGALSFSILLTMNPTIAVNVKQRLESFYNFNTEKNIHTESIRERKVLWNSSIQLAKDHPFSGVGAGNWKFAYAEKGMPERCQTGEVAFMQPHNDFLWVLAETGVFGGLAFVILFAIAMIALFRSFLKGKDIFTNMALLSGITMYAAHSFFDFPKERPLILFTFSCMLALVNFRMDNSATNISNGKWKVILVLMPAVSLLTASFWVVRIHGEVNVKKAIAAQNTRNFPAMKNYLGKICYPLYESDPAGEPIAWYRGVAAYYEGDMESFMKHAEDALRLSPFRLNVLYNLGLTYCRLGDTSAAIKYWDQAVALAPEYSEAAVNLSVVYYNQGELPDAASLLLIPRIDYQDEKNALIVATILGEYVRAMSDTADDLQTRESLIRLSMDAERLKNLQKQMAEKEQSSTGDWDVEILVYSGQR